MSNDNNEALQLSREEMREWREIVRGQLDRGETMGSAIMQADRYIVAVRARRMPESNP